MRENEPAGEETARSSDGESKVANGFLDTDAAEEVWPERHEKV